MKKWSILSILFVLLLVDTSTLFAQSNRIDISLDKDTLDTTDIWSQSKYLAISYGINHSKFRDLATSPLFYYGKIRQLSLFRQKSGIKRDSEWGFTYDAGLLQSSRLDNKAFSNLKRLSLNCSRLYKIPFLDARTINTKLGYTFSAHGNFRINQALLNNSFGLDFFANILGVIKFQKDVSRKIEKQKRFLFWKYKLRKRKRDLACLFNVGIMNSSLRNGFVYSGQAALLNKFNPISSYQFKLFSGYRLGTQIDFTTFLSNHNALRYSYVWDVYSTGSKRNKFDMAHHTIKLTLLFNTNNR